MEILLTPEQWVLDLYPIEDNGSDYKLSNYIIKTEVEEGILMIHTITWSIYLLSRSEYENIMNNNLLKRNMVVVPVELDELAIAEKVYTTRINKPQLPTYDVINTLVILTTTSCNARCYYCYEQNIEKKEMMTLETAENIIQFILKRRPVNNTPVRLQWFGGEPLLNIRVIEYIVDRLYELNIPFKTSMISNSFLLTEEVSKKLDYWKVESVQITLDGINEEYNQAKNYIYSDVDAYLQVIDNMHHVLKNSNTRISVRFNASNNNIFKLYDDIMLLKEEFKGYNKIGFYAAPLFEYLEFYDHAVEGYWEELERLKSIVTVAKPDRCDEVNERDTYKRHKIDSMCMAFNGNGMAVLPNGSFTPCEHIKDDDIFGNVIDGVTNVDVIKKWQTFDGPEIDYCRETMCPLHPLCSRFYKCDGSMVCTEPTRKERRLAKAVEKLIRTKDFYFNELRKINGGN